MPKFMSADTALKRLVEDTQAPVLARCDALRQLAHPPLCMLRRLLAIPRSLTELAKRKKPIPPRLRAIATLKYAQELQFRKLKGGQRKKQDVPSNALGIA